MSLNPLPTETVLSLVRHALREDLGDAGDITTDAIIPADQTWKAALVARAPGVVAGMDFARHAFALCGDATLDVKKPDGSPIAKGDVLAIVSGNARAIITGERVALNYMCRLSGIASATAQLVAAVNPHKARISCTRKTTPGLRAAEKYAVRAGGGFNHRFGLYDAVLIKDNHIAAAGDLRTAVLRARQHLGHLVKVELEVDTLDQLTQALELPIDVVLLDNMRPDQLAEAVKLVDGRFVTEASGGVTLQSVNAIAATGVDVISAGWLTHSAPILDIGLDAI